MPRLLLSFNPSSFHSFLPLRFFVFLLYFLTSLLSFLYVMPPFLLHSFINFLPLFLFFLLPFLPSSVPSCSFPVSFLPFFPALVSCLRFSFNHSFIYSFLPLFVYAIFPFLSSSIYSCSFPVSLLPFFPFYMSCLLLSFIHPFILFSPSSFLHYFLSSFLPYLPSLLLPSFFLPSFLLPSFLPLATPRHP